MQVRSGEEGLSSVELIAEMADSDIVGILRQMMQPDGEGLGLKIGNQINLGVKDGERQEVGGCAGINRHVAGDERALQERRERLHPDPESCRRRREAGLEA